MFIFVTEGLAAIRSEYPTLANGVVSHFEVVLVSVGVVIPAKKRGVFGTGFAAGCPVVEGVVDFAALRRLVASGINATLVTGDYSGAHMGGHGTLAAPDIEDLTVWPEYDPPDSAVAC